MTRFLSEVANRVISHQNNAFLSTVVLPSKRACLFFRMAYLAQVDSAPQVLPEILTISDLVNRFSSSRKVSPVQAQILLFESYLIAAKEQNQQAESFAEFDKWASTFINDLAELINHRVDLSTFFRELTALKSLEITGDSGKSAAQNNFLSFWGLLEITAHHFLSELKSLGLATPAIRLNEAASSLPIEQLTQQKRQFYFAGFNALNPLEKEIISKLGEAGLCRVYWDGDPFYLNQPHFETNKFFTYPAQRAFEEWITTDLQNTLNLLHNHACPGLWAQTQAVGNTVKQLIENQQANPSDIALVVTDESLLLPLLQNLNLVDAPVNVTMGVSMRSLPLTGLLNLLFDYQYGIIGAKEKELINAGILHKLLYNPYLQHVTQVSVLSEQLGSQLFERNFIGLDELTKHTNQVKLPQWLLSVLLPCHHSALDFSESLLVFFKTLLDHHPNNTIPEELLAKQWLCEAIVQIEETHKLLQEVPYETGLSFLKRLIQQGIQSSKINLFGEPVLGIQIMGMLESRALDFPYVLVLGANEGNMPGTGVDQSLIPYDLKLHHSLPLKELKEKIYGYYFYRLMNRAKEVHLFYNSIAKDNAGEKSRFLLQLENELPNYLLKGEIIHTKWDTPKPLQFSPKTPRQNQKTQDKLIALLSYGLSPSALNSYLACKQDFYYKYVLGIKQENARDDASATDHGNLIHQTLEELYKPFINKPIGTEQVQEFIQVFPSVLEEIASNIFGARAHKSGKPLLYKEIAHAQIEKYLKKELKQLSESRGLLTILGLEKTLEYPIQFGDHSFVLKGNIDRIHVIDGVLQIVDYKTGTFLEKDVTIHSIDELFEKYQKMAVQLCIYGLFARKHYPQYESTAGILDVKGSTKDLVTSLAVSTGRGKKETIVFTKEIEEQLVTGIKGVFEEMLSDELSFEHNLEAKYCSYCRY